MDTSKKIIRGIVKSVGFTITSPITQWDYGWQFIPEIEDLPPTYRLDFSNEEKHGTALPVYCNTDGAEVPTELIDTGKDIWVWFVRIGDGYGITEYKWRIPNKCKPKTEQDEPTPSQQSSIDQAISVVNEAVEDAQDAQEAIENMSVSAQTLAEGSSATVTKTESEGVVHLEFGIPRGATGAQGERGEKGDKGDTGAQGIKGDKGDTGAQGIQGEKGDKGDKGDTGATGAKGEQGERGLTGADGISPTVTITPITGGHRITITDADGEHSADVMDGTGNVEDVQINGTSIVSDGVANVPIASTSKFGVVKTRNGFGIGIDSNGQIYSQKGSATDVKLGTQNYNSITPSNQHESTFYGLAKAAGADDKNSTLPVGNYTEDAKSAISEMLGGSVSVSGTTPTIVAKSGIRYVCGEVATLDFTPSQTGICDVVFTSGSTPTVLTVPNTIKWANGFDPTSLDANTTYELNIMDGLGVACAWA